MTTGRETFEQALVRLRGATSLRELARQARIDAGHLSRVARGVRPPNPDLARALDRTLGTGGQLEAIIAERKPARFEVNDFRPWETAELLGRIRASAINTGTIESLEATVIELCCEYPTRDARSLRQEAHGWLGEIDRQLRKPVGLAAHEGLLHAAGWLALLTGCLEYDIGQRAAAEATRVAARQLGEEGGNPEIIGWSFEMSAWFALTQGRLRAVLDAARAGQAAAPGGSAAVQLAGQEAKAHARVRNKAGVRDALERGRTLLASRPDPLRPDHHFIVDPAKWDFYAMDAYRLAGDDARAAQHARTVLKLGASPDGELAPMRMTEARLTLAALAARNGDLEQAVTAGIGALNGQRKSLPSLLMVGGELDAELHERYPGESGPADFREALRSVAAGT
ncbi:helix-turn-helix transcriptional regulator [Actinoplanes sp. NPDC023936]|uniref:helix-turn-helix domain-containing protein n=1 Tax=Actinoplanes sp. NPDC023936 TaxID=3154910 RepID=UPI0033FC1642